MWIDLLKFISNTISITFTRLIKRDCKETWQNLEMRRGINLENHEDLKKFQINHL